LYIALPFLWLVKLSGEELKFVYREDLNLFVAKITHPGAKLQFFKKKKAIPFQEQPSLFKEIV